MNKSTYTTTRFDVGNDRFYVEVSPVKLDGDDMVEFYLCKEDYGIKNYMFGMFASECPESDWENEILKDINDHITGYYNDMELIEGIEC